MGVGVGFGEKVIGCFEEAGDLGGSRQVRLVIGENVDKKCH